MWGQRETSGRDTRSVLRLVKKQRGSDASESGRKGRPLFGRDKKGSTRTARQSSRRGGVRPPKGPFTGEKKPPDHKEKNQGTSDLALSGRKERNARPQVEPARKAPARGKGSWKKKTKGACFPRGGRGSLTTPRVRRHSFRKPGGEEATIGTVWAPRHKLITTGARGTAHSQKRTPR